MSPEVDQMREDAENANPAVAGYATAKMLTYLHSLGNFIQVFSGDKLTEVKRRIPSDAEEAFHYSRLDLIWNQPGVCEHHGVEASDEG